jgi:hypothetical protein
MQHFNDAYIEAFDAGNAQALATLFTEDSLDPPTYRDFNYTKVFVRQGDLWKIAAVQFANLPSSQPKSS